jgi:hypothetical protein
VIGGPAGDRPPADDLAAQVQRRSIACLEALRGWSPPRVDVAAPRTGTGEEHETPTP